ncbi:MAG: ChbG/HpnK family deacetylase [Candidatus Omnitrophica bacterium]|nr:ChbG/HpnK family deacetylase [Candidatus Omnitrophota bacterium]
MKRVLIVNADDCNLTRGVTRAILECHDTGIVSSTTFMANLPVEPSTVRELKKRKNLGLGIHLNITFSKPVSKAGPIKSLLAPNGNFRKLAEQFSKLPRASQVLEEYSAQIRHFKSIFGVLPDHLDTHHQVHDHPFFFGILIEAAKKSRLPIRRSALMNSRLKMTNVVSPEFTFGNLTAEGYWRAGPLEAILRNLPEGVSEIMCHPGICDRELKTVSSFTTGREAERKLFRAPSLRRLLQSSGIALGRYGSSLCYT